MDLPVIVRVWLEGVTNPGEIDAEVYCVNHTDQPFLVTARSTSFTTVDEEAGTALRHGSYPVETLVLPGEAKRVGDVAGWEWDGAVGMQLRFRAVGSAASLRAGYNLRNPAEAFTIEPLGKRGHIIPPSFSVLEEPPSTVRPAQGISLDRLPLLGSLLRWLRARAQT